MFLKETTKWVLTLELYITMKRVLTLKPPRSQTEGSTKNKDCSKTTANLGSDEVAEPEAEATLKEISDANSLSSNNGVLQGLPPPTVEDNTKRINELTKLVENRLETILKTISLQNNQQLKVPANIEVSAVSDFKSQINSIDPKKSHTTLSTESISTLPNTATKSSIPSLSHEDWSFLIPRAPNLYPNVDQPNERSSSQLQGTNFIIAQLQRKIENLERKVDQNSINKNITTQYNTNHIFGSHDPVPRNQNFQQTVNSRLSNHISDKTFRKISRENSREELDLFEIQCKSQGIFDDQTKFEIIIGIWPINDVLAYVGAGKPTSYSCFKQEILSMISCVPDILKPPPNWSHTPTFKDVHQLVSKSLTCSPDDLYKHLTLNYSPKWAKEVLKKYLELPIDMFKKRVMWTLQQGPTDLKIKSSSKKSYNQQNFKNKFLKTFNQNQNYSQYNRNRNNYTKDYTQYQNQFSNKNPNKCRYHIRFG